MVTDHHDHEHDSHCGGGQAHDDHRGTGQADQVDLPAEACPVRIMTQVADAAAGLIAAVSKAAGPPGKVSQRQWQRAE